MNIVFFGSSLFSLPTLQILHKNNHKILAVISTPDEKKGRGLKEGPTPVTRWARDRSLECLTPEKLKTPDFLSKIKQLNPELLVIASYGKLLPEDLLAIPAKGNLNVHPSLLPKYRGAAPIQRALLNGDVVTGVSIMRLVRQMDAGDVLLQKSLPIGPNENAEELSGRLAELGADLLLEGVRILETNSNPGFHKQDERLATYASKVQKEEGFFTWQDSASSIHRKVRAFYSWPVARTQFRGEILRVFKTQLADEMIPKAKTKAEPGRIVKISQEKGLLIQTQNEVLWASQLQLPGKKVLDGFHFAMGQRLVEGMNLSR